MDVSRARLIGRWVHAHEEDTEAGRVFRPADHPLPPSRGREAWDLRADGSFAATAPGPTDEPAETAGSWQLDGDRLLISGPDDTARARELTIVESAPDRLVLLRGAQAAGGD